MNTLAILRKSIRVQGIYVGSVSMFNDMNRAITLHKLHPIVDHVYEFVEANLALQKMASASHFGKIVVRI